MKLTITEHDLDALGEILSEQAGFCHKDGSAYAPGAIAECLRDALETLQERQKMAWARDHAMEMRGEY
jgi:hypothetical protein